MCIKPGCYSRQGAGGVLLRKGSRVIKNDIAASVRFDTSGEAGGYSCIDELVEGGLFQARGLQKYEFGGGCPCERGCRKE